MNFSKKSSFLIAYISLILNFAVALMALLAFLNEIITLPLWKDMRYGAFSAFIFIMMFFDGV
jgi:hypothetical protein